ncbi:hypothetical protein JB92DRAFT_1670305 [Gautieria morchelliformis]|nr:hypothetical protein JB92DRAFT_1670305 [Gautieria morchelliformis]
MAHAYAADRGTLSPGQTILVNNYTIQVEKYLNQGGFAHVYLVRSATPIHNTTQHVLKRIAVADEAMLVEVKKEVDIMRLLRGHPNIVNFIDASWHTLPNGTYEVFILMEFCNGGGIIDMMNRRLRERLTEAEILQIFVDVCEAVAAMHNLKPALLHRDLKVENILQSSLTRYKLCDFGSSTHVLPRPPSSMHEIRLLEADLNKHTTLQYRAPEMVDVHLRRPVDEKSDVWALGVLLYKLCYYTTPFEEHGPLAILNVQYKIPPYPVYSPQINSLIASMLRELGTQRPSVFEILSLVHRIRGTKSPYRYDIPSPQSFRPSLQESKLSSIDDVVSFRPPSIPTTNITSAAQARQTVLDAIAPMRRGRPATSAVSAVSASSVPPKHEHQPDVRKFDDQWNAVRKANVDQAVDDVWNIRNGKAKPSTVEGLSGFGDSFVESAVGKTTASLTSTTPAVSKKPPIPGLGVQKDAFDGLGGISRSLEPSPTLAEATNNARSNLNRQPPPPPRLNGISRTPIPAATATPLSPRIPASRTGLARYHPPASLSVEERFPSLDELDKGWRSPAISSTYLDVELKSHHPTQSRTEDYRSSPSGIKLSGSKNSNIPLIGEARSQQVTGTTMRDNQAETGPLSESSVSTSKPEPVDKRPLPIGSSPTKYRPSRPALARRHRSSLSIKATDTRPAPQDWLTGDDPVPVKSPTESHSSPLKRSPSAAFSLGPSMASSAPSKLTGTSTQNTDAHTPEATKPYEQKGASPSRVTGSHNNVANSTRAAMHAHVPHRQDSSSDDAEEPEDVNGRVMDNRGKRRAKGRQSSVHDLVDLYGGAAKVPADRERTGLSSPALERKERRTSGILVDLSLPPSASPAPTLLSPTSIVPDSRAELATRRSGSSSLVEQTSPAHLTESSEHKSQPTSRLSPGAPALDRSDRPRPQSMFMFPPKPSMDPTSNLRAPEGQRQRASPRRGSISDMVDLYENLGGGARPKDPPAFASKPVGLRSKTPSPITSRFPPISPSGVSFSVGQVTSLLTEQSKTKPKPKPRRSPTVASFGDYNSLGPPAVETAKLKDDFVTPVPRRQSVSPGKQTTGPVKGITPSAAPSKPLKPASLSIPKTVDLTPAPVAETLISSPSPERPYQGVSKLIDQWQKKTEEADASPRLRAPRRPTGPRIAHGRHDAGKGG